METLKEQISQAVEDFVATLRQLAQRRTEHIFQETFSALGAKRGTKPTNATSKPRGAKRDASELDQLSNRFAQFVHANPGLRIEQINKQLGTTTKDLALPIRKLISEGQISVKGQKRSTAYFPGKSASTTAEEAKGEDTDSSSEAPAKKSKKRAASKKGRAGAKSKAKAKSKS